uniref:Uncharacterized protein n=1 Tax=Chrysemys picta bellii TaxID=8478 RepID=A0A8C3IL96_CHRPI
MCGHTMLIVLMECILTSSACIDAQSSASWVAIPKCNLPQCVLGSLCNASWDQNIVAGENGNIASASHDALCSLPHINGKQHSGFCTFKLPRICHNPRSMEHAQLCTLAVSISNTPCAFSFSISRAEARSTTWNIVLFCKQPCCKPLKKNNSQLLLAVTEQLHTVEHHFWSHETGTDWWDRIVFQVWDDEQWRQNFQMQKATFQELCAEISPVLPFSNTKIRAALTVEKRMAIAIWKLATPDSYPSVENQFGVGKSTMGAS